MIAATYTVAGLGLLATGYVFSEDCLTATELTLCWSAIFFVASAAASSAYLTVSEIFPLEMRAVVDLALLRRRHGARRLRRAAALRRDDRDAAAAARSSAPTHSPRSLMCAAALVAWYLGVDAERRPLEEVCAPLGSEPERLRYPAHPRALRINGLTRRASPIRAALRGLCSLGASGYAP